MRRSSSLRCPGDDGVDVENDGHATIAEDGRAGHAEDAAVIGLEALDDDLLLADDAVDHQRALRLVFGLDHHRHALERVRLLVAVAEHGPDIDQRDERAANADDPRLLS